MRPKAGSAPDRLYRLTEAIGPEGPATYEYDAVGNRVSMTRGGATTTYDYDRADRITRAGPTGTTVNADGNLVARGADSSQGPSAQPFGFTGSSATPRLASCTCGRGIMTRGSGGSCSATRTPGG